MPEPTTAEGSGPLVRLQISPTPAQVRTARLVAAAVGRRSGLAEEALDEVRLAVGEACSRAVSLHRAYAPDELVTVVLEVDGAFVVSVCDVAPAGGTEAAGDLLGRLDDMEVSVAGDEPLSGEGFGLAVISGLVDDVRISPGPDGRGTIVRMAWPLPAG